MKTNFYNTRNVCLLNLLAGCQRKNPRACRADFAADRPPRNLFKHTFLITLIIICFITLDACTRKTDWVQFRGENGLGVSSSRIVPPLGIRWKIKLQENKQKLRSLNPPVVIGDTIYFGSDDGNFYALDAESGYMRWVFKSGARINSIPYADKDQVYFGSKDGKLYALSRETGELVWTFQTNSQINSQVQRYKDYIVFVGDADAVYFLSPDGKEEFSIDNPGWYNFTFLMANDIMYFGTGPQVHQVGPFDINRREFLWFLNFEEIEATWYSVTAIKGDLLHFGTADVYGEMYLGFHAVNKRTGKIVWQQRKEGVLKNWDYEDIWGLFLRSVDLLDFMAPVIWKDLVIYAGGDSVARAFDSRTGVQRWQKEFDTPISCAPTVAAGRVYFGLIEGDHTPPKFVCISARDGKLLWEIEIEGSVLSAPVIAGKRIIFGTDESVFYVLEQVF